MPDACQAPGIIQALMVDHAGPVPDYGIWEQSVVQVTGCH